jgi:hypothetical protein
MSQFEKFNTMMRTFLEELSEVFPEDMSMRSSVTTFDELVSINFKKPQQMFMEVFTQYAKFVAERDERMFENLNFPGINFKKMWMSDISSSTKDAIWAYLSHLLVLGVNC